MTPRLRRGDEGDEGDEGDGVGQGRRARVTRRPQPRHITLGGREAVALTPEEYERLIVSRRQIGGQSARVRVLAQQVKRTEELLRDLEALAGRPPEGCPGPCVLDGDTTSCPRTRTDTSVPRPGRSAGAETDSECLRWRACSNGTGAGPAHRIRVTSG